MIEILDQTRDNLIAVKATGTVTTDEYKEALSFFHKKSEQYEALSLYCELVDIDQVALGAIIKDVKFDFKHGNHLQLERTAIVGDSWLEEWATNLWEAVNPFWPISAEELRYFDLADRVAALAWVEATL